MSKNQESLIEKSSNSITIFLFLFGIIVSAAVLAISIELVLVDSPQEFKSNIMNYESAYNSIGEIRNIQNILNLVNIKVELYRTIMSNNLTLWAIPVTVMSIVMTFIMGVSRSVMVDGLKERISQHRRVLSQERKRKKDALIQLEKSEDHLFHIHEQLTEAFLVVNRDERFHHANRIAVHLLAKWNRTPKSVRHYLEQPVEAFIPDYHSSGLGLCVQDAISKKLSWQKELFLEKIDAWLQVRVYPTGGDSAYVYMCDISNEKKPDHLKRLGEDMVSAIAETAPTSIAILDRQWNYLVVSKKWREDFKLLDEELIGKSHKAIMPRLPGKWQAIEGQVLDGKIVKSEAMLFQLNGKDEHVSWEISPWKVGGKIQGYIMYASIITEMYHNREKLEQQREREHQLAYHDILTGLPNRQLFYDRLTMGLAQAYRNLGKIALFFIDLDGFKGINDTLGHDIGDMLLKEVAIRLKQCVRDTDTVARLGGDEFCVILNGVASEEDAMHVANKINKHINEVFKLADNDVYVSTSIGISMYPLDGSTSAELIKKADSAMYWSKEGGKNQANFFTKEFNAASSENHESTQSKGDNSSVVSQRELEAEIRTALQKNEIETYFQPQYNYKTKEVFGLEALIRWNHPVAGVLEPRKFLNIAENTGMILPMGEKVLGNVAIKAKEWRSKSGVPLTFSVNFSRRQLKDTSLSRRIRKIFTQHDIPFEWLVAEIPEDVLLDHDEAIEKTLSELKAIGCQIYVDDLGLGYTTMKQLENLPLSGIKIHESFVHNALNSIEDKSKLTSMVTLAHNLQIKVIAEGVETVEQAEFLVGIGCDDIQGFIVGKPLQPRQIEELFE